MAIEIRPLTRGLGAEIIGADVRNPDHFKTLADAFTQYEVIAIRDQHITPEEQIDFADRLGPINVNRFFAHVPGHPEIAMVLKEPDQVTAVGERWHTDHSYDEIPAKFSMLHAIETPEYGGDTNYASMSKSFATLSEGLKETLRGLNGWHSSRHIFGAVRTASETAKTGRINNPELANQDSLHPVIIRHPKSNRECLYVNPDFFTHFDGWSKEESQALLAYLVQHSTKPEHLCRVRWYPGTITIWDNLATWHKAVNDYDGHRRLMHRITIDGEPLIESRVPA
ncbi:MAG: TauD/TfdA family dioxygenase [Rhodospirillaceae bacterium]